MKNYLATILMAAILAFTFALTPGCSKRPENKGHGEAHETAHHEEEAGHNDEKAGHGEEKAGHGEEEEGHHEEEEEGEEGVVTLDEKQVSLSGIKTEKAKIGNIDVELQLPGEVGLDENRTVHIVPRVSGTVRKVHKNLGDAVRAGETLAVIESSELGEAKSDYLEKKQGLDQARFDLERMKTVRDNAGKMIAFLKARPSLPELEKVSSLDLGQYRQALVSSYSELVFARAAYEREKELYEKKISSGGEYQEAENAFKKAESEFAAARDEISFEVKRAHEEKKRTVRSAELSLGAAERNLHLLGLGQPAIRAIAGRNGNHDSLSLYSVTAPFGGTIVEKHAAHGEQVGAETELFTVSDMEIVWVMASVNEKDIAKVRVGQRASVTVEAYPGQQLEGAVKWIGDTIEERSRTLKIRIQIGNGKRMLKPGMFARIALKAGEKKKALVIPSSSVQRIKGEPVVFVDAGSGRFEKREVRLGASASKTVEVVSGVREGESVVSSGGFVLKSELEKAGVGDPHGH